MQSIPIVNLRDYFSDSKSAKETFVRSLGDALRDIGFFSLEGHGIDATIIENAYSYAEKVFSLPTKTKSVYEDVPGSVNRGYVSYQREIALGATVGDLKEFWHVGREIEEGESVPNNVWPHEVVGFKEAFMALYEQLDQLSLAL